MASVIDLAVTKTSTANQEAPAGSGWTVVKNKYGEAQDFNKGAGGDHIWVWYQSGEDSNYVSGLRFITGQNKPAPKGWIKCDIDLNLGAGGDYIYLCYKKAPGFNCIERLVAGCGKSTQSAMDDFNKIAVVLRQNTNKGTGGDSKFIFLGYEYND